MTKPKKINTEVYSKAVEQCLRDLEWAEKSPNHEIDMGYWCLGTEICQVCLGGAALVHRYGFSGSNFTRTKTPFDTLPIEDSYVIASMDYLRRGWLLRAFTHARAFNGMDRDDAIDLVRDIEMVSLKGLYYRYEDSPKLFKKWLRAVIKELRKVGL